MPKCKLYFQIFEKFFALFETMQKLIIYFVLFAIYFEIMSDQMFFVFAHNKILMNWLSDGFRISPTERQSQRSLAIIWPILLPKY